MKQKLLMLLSVVLIHAVGNSQTNPRKDVGKILEKAPIRMTELSKLEASKDIELIYPSPYCPTGKSKPDFRWRENKKIEEGNIYSYSLKVVEMNIADTVMDDFDKRKIILELHNIKSDSVRFPEKLAKLEMRKLYGWRIRKYRDNQLVSESDAMPFYIVDGKYPFNLSEMLCCQNTILKNGDFAEPIVGGMKESDGKKGVWQAAYGRPTVMKSDDGCGSPNYVQLSGNKVRGAAIAQQVNIQKGKHYKLTACVRLCKEMKAADYVYVNAIAYNGTLSVGELHPAPGSSVAVIGWSGKIKSRDWISFSMPVWTPNKNFEHIAIYVSSAAEKITVCADIDKICLQETKDSISCDDYQYDLNGNVIIPGDMTAYAGKIDTTRYEHTRGRLVDLYEGYDGTTSFYKDNNPCSSTGGAIPETVSKFNMDDSLKALGIIGGIAELDSILNTTFKDTSAQKILLPIQPLTNSNCKVSYRVDNTQPFSGRDIIFVHGLNLSHLCDRASGFAPAEKNWPDDKPEFYGNGYYKQKAVDTWRDHIQEWIRGRGYKNRVLVVAYNCSQRADVAAHTILTQIRDAMNSGIDVQYMEGDNRKNECFGRDAVVFSHSTGGLIADIALSIAEKSKFDPLVQARYGNVGFISDNIKLHIGSHAAFRGSKMATVFLASQTIPVLNKVFAEMSACADYVVNGSKMSEAALKSILVDLQPSVATTLWMPIISTSPVPTLTIAGGHSFGVHELKPTMNTILHPGNDDGVVTMGSQSANPFFETGPLPVGFLRQPGAYKLYDMGLGFGDSRANNYFLNQTAFTSSPFVGGASTAYISPTGMLQPVASVPFVSNPERRIPNHYSFLQTASDHYVGPRGKSIAEGYSPFNHTGTSGFKTSNYDYYNKYGRHWEESLVITNNTVFAKGLISPSVLNLPEERVKGEYIEFDVWGPQMSFKCCPRPRFKFWWGPMFHVRITLWERKYHLLSDAEAECECSYIYKYVLRN
jgi:hypothetical protein